MNGTNYRGESLDKIEKDYQNGLIEEIIFHSLFIKNNILLEKNQDRYSSYDFYINKIRIELKAINFHLNFIENAYIPSSKIDEYKALWKKDNKLKFFIVYKFLREKEETYKFSRILFKNVENLKKKYVFNRLHYLYPINKLKDIDDLINICKTCKTS